MGWKEVIQGLQVLSQGNIVPQQTPHLNELATLYLLDKPRWNRFSSQGQADTTLSISSMGLGRGQEWL